MTTLRQAGEIVRRRLASALSATTSQHILMDLASTHRAPDGFPCNWQITALGEVTWRSALTSQRWRGDRYVKLGTSASPENVVPRAHDFEETAVRYSRLSPILQDFEMNSSELVTIVAEAHDISKAQAQAILDSVLKSIVKAAASDDEVSLAGFGKFKVKASPEREGRNPANGEKIKIAASKKLSFSPAKAVKDVLNS